MMPLDGERHEAQTASAMPEAPMGAYLIADVHITDPATYEEYKRQVSPLIARFGGRYAARAGRHEVLEGDWEPHRLVVLEFPDMAALKGKAGER